MIAKLFSPLIAKILGGLLIATLLFGGVQTWRAGYWKQVATVLRLDLDKIKLAQTIAGERAVAAKAAEEARTRLNSERTDSAHQTELARLRALADRYANANRVRSKAPGGASSGAPAPTNNHSPQGADGPGTDAVVLDRDDFDIMVENTARLKAAHDWATTLNAGTADSPPR